MHEPLTQREFDTWRESDRAFKEQVLSHMEYQETTNRDTARRVTSLEIKDSERSVFRVGFISSVISAIVGGVTGAVFGRG